jgi:hypothetical protein
MFFVVWELKREVCKGDATKIGVVHIAKMGKQFRG